MTSSDAERTTMQYRPLGATGLRVSSVGFGTAQLRRVSETQAIDTLLKGFDLGVNIVHTASDYEGADRLVAAAVARTPHKVVVACNAYDVQGNRTGRVRTFERLFENTCRLLKTDRLELFGIASVEDREAFGENVWGRRGMVEFLQRMKSAGRLGATFCTSHGKPEFTRKLIESGAFDAIMLAYNELGFHSLTLNPPPNWHFEDVRRTGDELLPLCAERNVGVMVMLPMGGGLICRSKAFPPDDDVYDNGGGQVSGADVLRSILGRPDVSCVLPGTACVEEADENARTGHVAVGYPGDFISERSPALSERLRVLQGALCSRCGECEPKCSQQLPITWMVRAAYMNLYPNSPYETWEDVEYFRVHPKLEATCATCPDVTCACPSGLDVPRLLTSLHERMLEQLRRGRVASPPAERPAPAGNRWFGARVVSRELPDEMQAGETYTGRLFVENCGFRRWHPPGVMHGSSVRLRVRVDDVDAGTFATRSKVVRLGRCHFVFDLAAPHGRDAVDVRLELVRHHRWLPDPFPLVLFSGQIPVRQKGA